MIQSDGIHAHYYQRLAWANAFNSLGYETKLWWSQNVSPFDAFDTFNPDIFLGQTYNLTESLVKCIKERPWMKVALRAPDWGSQVTDERFRILKAEDEEKRLVEQLREETGQPQFLHIHYPEYALENTHDKWKETGVPVKSIMMCADVNSYVNAQYIDALSCDLAFVGGYWPYKGQVIDKYLLPLLGKDLKVKIFGNQPWPDANEYCGQIRDENVKHLFASAKICPNLSEPHAQEYGYDINERVFKVLFCGGMCVTDPVEGLARTFKDGGLSFATDPKDFEEKIRYFLDDDEARREVAERGRYFVVKDHTNFHRVEQILEGFGVEEPKIKEYKDAIK